MWSWHHWWGRLVFLATPVCLGSTSLLVLADVFLATLTAVCVTYTDTRPALVAMKWFLWISACFLKPWLAACDSLVGLDSLKMCGCANAVSCTLEHGPHTT